MFPGSVIHLIDQIRAGNPIPSLSFDERFIMSLDEAVDLVLFAFEHGELGNSCSEAPACTTRPRQSCHANYLEERRGYKVIGINSKMTNTSQTNNVLML